MAGDSDLIVNVDLLIESESALSKIQKELKDINNRKDEMRPYWGSGEISEAMGDFVDNWDDYRTKMIESLEGVGKLITNTIDGFTGADAALAKELKKARKGK
ncbi:WXG100 family type VII secretion target [Streptomyces griseomycini]|uniref:Uncharacterized protein YukE n=1 Tax=Streptomyces griseomycini TaxID=66895 RepID=A0A7W7PPQ5_9ACTN|nr:hypothetical protein [Streptomyces griseomycini]MBB4897739.1 uncharacterized protein YukE [Streptomyces griseomycini]GGQ20422.1 hypothetical protein GCM10010266_49460 [Streptomyces griseomycini]GGR11716.1 hypothetical protein GCM10015536_16530 [Streptomyces griseomycini]